MKLMGIKFKKVESCLPEKMSYIHYEDKFGMYGETITV